MTCEDKLNNSKARAVYMLRIAAKYIRQTDPEGRILYGGVFCDGECVAEDCAIAASELERSP